MYAHTVAVIAASARGQDGAYWASWALTHYGTLFLSCALCAGIGMYPFPRTPPLVMATLLWLAAAALLAFAYFLSTLFSKSRVAGLATALLYALAMVPGWATSPPRRMITTHEARRAGSGRSFP